MTEENLTLPDTAKRLFGPKADPEPLTASGDFGVKLLRELGLEGKRVTRIEVIVDPNEPVLVKVTMLAPQRLRNLDYSEVRDGVDITEV